MTKNNRRLLGNFWMCNFKVWWSHNRMFLNAVVFGWHVHFCGHPFGVSGKYFRFIRADSKHRYVFRIWRICNFYYLQPEQRAILEKARIL